MFRVLKPAVEDAAGEFVVFAEPWPLLSSSLPPSGQKIHGKEVNIDPSAVDRCYCLRLLLLLVLIRGEGWGMSSLSADEDVIACWGERWQCLPRVLVVPAGGFGLYGKRKYFFSLFPHTGELG